VSVSVPLIKGVEAPKFSIICSTIRGYMPCSDESSPGTYGVVTSSALATLTGDGVENAVQVVDNGIAVVRVSAAEGAISSGDLVATSKIPGVGVLATRNGFVLGTALEDFDSTDPQTVGEILVAINVHPSVEVQGAGTSIVDALRRGLSTDLLTGPESLRYIIALGITLASFATAFAYFGRVARSGVEALGRNPLARNTIQIGIFVNVLMGVVIVAVGLGVSVMILIF